MTTVHNGYVYSVNDRGLATGNGGPAMSETAIAVAWNHIYKTVQVLICWALVPGRGTMTAAEILLGLAILYAVVVLIWLRRQDE